MESKEASIQFYRFLFKYRRDDLDTCGQQFSNALAVYLFKAIPATDSNPGNSFPNNKVGAGRCTTKMGAGLQCDIHY